jgi:hypothetical protein
LFEEANNNISCGYTRNYIKVCVKSENDTSGKILDVKLVNNLGNMAQGNIL